MMIPPALLVQLELPAGQKFVLLLPLPSAGHSAHPPLLASGHKHYICTLQNLSVSFANSCLEKLGH